MNNTTLTLTQDGVTLVRLNSGILAINSGRINSTARQALIVKTLDLLGIDIYIDALSSYRYGAELRKVAELDRRLRTVRLPDGKMLLLQPEMSIDLRWFDYNYTYGGDWEFESYEMSENYQEDDEYRVFRNHPALSQGQEEDPLPKPIREILENLEAVMNSHDNPTEED